MFDTVTVVGVGLIGGSFGLVLKERKLAKKVIGISRSKESIEAALRLGLIDETLELSQAVAKSDLIYVAIPVDATVTVVGEIMDMISGNQIVADAGSTKYALCNSINGHPMRRRFVATHPMWGTEFSGPEAATRDSFAGRSCVICEREQCEEDALLTIEEIYKTLGMHLVYMDAASHDMHAAYVSHIAHITSFALANTVLEKEKEEDAIFELAGGGFESTVRLAKSSPAMWAPVFMQNRENVLDVLNEHISQLKKFKSCLEKENNDYLWELMVNANKIKRIIK
ncbi:MAG TPA: prephenate dehydrogenase [Puia sp.]|nr:prephenate dehydrogenase [Puia sp.]